MKVKAVIAAAVVVVVLVGAAVVASPADGAGAAIDGPDVSSSVILVTSYKVIDVTTSSPWIDFTRPVARCTAAEGSTCTISRAAAVGTTVQAGLGYSQAGVAASIGFSLTRMSTTTVSCTSPKMPVAESYVGYSEGTFKSYKIQKWQTNSAVNAPPPHLVATSGWLSAYQPFSYPSIYCDLES